MVPEASPLSIDLLSPNFSVTYALLNSHYCAHWSLIRENNRLVVTEGRKYERARDSVSVNSWLRLLEPSRWPPRSCGPVFSPASRILNSIRTVCRWIRKLDLACFIKTSPQKTEGRLLSHKTVAVICLQQWWLSVPAWPLSARCYLFLSIICFSALLDKE